MRIRTVLAAVGLAAAVITGTAGTAVAAPANDHDTITLDGNNSSESFGNTTTGGNESPELGLVQGSLNKPCVGLDGHADLGSLIGLIPITVQDVNVLDSPENQQCDDNSSQIQGDEPLSHLLSDDEVLSANG
ncbi:rodlin [Actinacidiphila acidipaludis]|uniref:RdlA protein n=1 Tax=Actinacidiphila acidipaludis TaxID=2873382 RepID=A0ABS7Q6Z3_9ACTN|nr:rodlin [Streptomyces acidipaludis]MBY8878918.1 RdlA protein [Streptomyces acidipaludis]